MGNEKMVRLIQRLIQKTENGDLLWEATPEDDQFITALSGYAVAVDLYHNERGDNYFAVTINNEDGRMIEKESNLALSVDWSEATAQMSRLYDLARRKAMGVDEALDKILSELDDDFSF